MKRTVLFACAAALTLSLSANAQTHRFDFGSETAADGFVAVTAATTYNAERGYGFEPGVMPVDIVRSKGSDLTKDYVTSVNPFFFSVKLPEGNYKVTLTLGDTQGTSCTTVKSEVRRLMMVGSWGQALDP